MTQEAVIRALQNGPLTSYQLENLTGIPRLSIAAVTALLARTLELHLNRPINLENLYK